MKPSLDALLTYAWVRSTYTALRSLSAFGLRVGVADTSQVGMGQWSRWRKFASTYTSPLLYPERFVRDIAALLQQTGAHFLLPGHDETEILARYRHLLPSNVILPVAEFEQIAAANNKALMAAKAEQLGVAVPRIYHWENLSHLAQMLDNIDHPLVVKLRRGNSAKGVFYPQNKEETMRLCEGLITQYNLLPERYPVVQEYVHGAGWGVSCLYWYGERLASFTHKRLREKTTTGGTSTLRCSLRNPILEAMAYRLLDGMNWHGLAMIEFKYDAVSQQGWFIEVNPRLWGSIHLAVTAGVDFPALLYIAATAGPEAARRKAQPQTEGISARWYLGDLIVSVQQLRQWRLGAAMKMALPGGKASMDDWHWDDPMAFVGEAMYYLTMFLKTRSLNPEQEGMLG